jgi:hypothetical protein
VNAAIVGGCSRVWIRKGVETAKVKQQGAEKAERQANVKIQARAMEKMATHCRG